MKIRIAYVEEPPFYWTDGARGVTGADIELADALLRAIGVSRIEHHVTSFEALLPGVQEGRWDMNVPIFVTPERAQRVAFSAPVWALGDGFLVRSGNPSALSSYADVARRDARLGVIAAQVQRDSARSAGVRDDRIVVFKDQPDAIEALLAGTIDAFAGTALGNRVVARAHRALEAVAHDTAGAAVPVGAFSFAKGNTRLLSSVNAQLQRHLGSAAHRAAMAKYGFTAAEIDGVI